MYPESKSLGVFEPLVGPWYESLRNPKKYQEQLLSSLLGKYSRTQYGNDHGAAGVKGIADFREHFPRLDYKGLAPYLSEVVNGNYGSLLPEPLACWVMTRGSTGPAKVLPATQTHIEQILTCGSRAIINYAFRTKNYELFDGKIFNLNFPSNVHTMTMNGQEMTYGYSSGTYARLIPALDQMQLLPKQEDIDSAGSGITKRDWENRFELAYNQALNQNVAAAMGVTPVILSFAKYVTRKHGKKPKDLWKLKALFCTSVRKIQFRYAPTLRKYFGQIPVIEMYSATEGVFGQQLDELPYITPNYDSYFFEVVTSRGLKMLHELKRGEWGELLVSSCMFPRYAIGDMIEAAGKDHFRVFGRQNFRTILEHRLHRMFLGWSI
jgi:hypothetical protein